MRFLCALLIALFALNSIAAAQGRPGRDGGGWGKPGTGGPKRPGGIGPRIPGIGLDGPSIIIGPAIRRPCPPGTSGRWPHCVAEQPKKCPKGTTGKWPACVKVVKPKPSACPGGQIRQGKKCVLVTEGGSGKRIPPKDPPKAKAKAQRPQPIAPAVAALVAGRPHRPREILVLVDAARASEIAPRLARENNVTADPQITVPLLDGAILRFRIAGNSSLESVLTALSADPDVRLAQPNYDYRATKDPLPPANPPHYAGEKIRLDEAHRLARGNGVKIAVIDTAIELDHAELAGAIAGSFDAVGGDTSTPGAHGTEIAGIIAARVKLKGVAPEAKLLSVDAFRGGKQAQAESTTLNLLKGIDWAFSAGAKIMNMSFVGPMDPLLERIIAVAAGNGVIFVAAAGNGGPKAPPAYPAAYPEVIAVTAVDEDDKLYAEANRGGYISVAAPGVDILVPALKGKYDIASGTSMAAAFVSGVAALVLERKGTLNAPELRELLSRTARKPIGPLGTKPIEVGILDAASALAEQEARAGAAVPAASAGR